MMPTLQDLKVTERDTTVTPHQLRVAGYIPATLYGKDTEPKSIQVRAHEFSQFLSQGVRNFKLSGFVQGEANARQVQRDPVSQKPISVQFQLTGK